MQLSQVIGDGMGYTLWLPLLPAASKEETRVVAHKKWQSAWRFLGRISCFFETKDRLCVVVGFPLVLKYGKTEIFKGAADRAGIGELPKEHVEDWKFVQDGGAWESDDWDQMFKADPWASQSKSS